MLLLEGIGEDFVESVSLQYSKMRGDRPTVKQLDIDLEELVLPINLLSDEQLPVEEEVEVELKEPFRVSTCCGICHTNVRLFVLATTPAIRGLEQLLLEDLNVVCVSCAKKESKNGR